MSFTKFFSIVFISLSFSISFSQQWEWQNPLPQGASMFTVIPLSEERTIITGIGGTIMTTEDGGANWHNQRLNEVDKVQGYSFISEQEGWIIDRSGKLYKTYNGGITWDELSITLQIDFSVYDINRITFIDNETGYLLANPPSAWSKEEQDKYPGLIYKTENGGIIWSQIDFGINRKYYQIVFTDNLNGFLLSQSYYSSYDFQDNCLHRTSDGGRTWEILNGRGYGKIKFIDKSIGWAGNYRTINGGKTWHYQEFNFLPSINSLSEITFTDSLIGYGIDYKTIYKTIDAGRSWTKQIETKNGLLQDIEFYDTLIGFTCGYGGTIHMTNNGGKNWKRYGEGVTEDLHDVFFLDENYGWVVGFNGTILHTINSGLKWEKQTIPSECDSTHFRGVDFINKEKGWVAGGDYIVSTTNSGGDWNIQLKVNLELGRFRDIKFLNENKGFAVGQKSIWGAGGIIYFTEDGGNNWARVDDGNLPILDEIFFIDEEYGWICGTGILLSTQDGGKNWYSTGSFNRNLRYLQFTDREHGWISSLDELDFYRTIDGGKSWQILPYENRFGQSLNSFYFFNNNQGIGASFVFPNILVTQDGGINWSFRDKLPTIKINSMTFIHDSLGWAVGSDGAIFRLSGSYFNTTSVENTDDNCKKKNVIAGIYPNPFNNITKIHYNLTYPQSVDINIYDMLGSRVESISKLNAQKGNNVLELNWQHKKITSGLYIIRISCKEYIKVIKSLYLK